MTHMRILRHHRLPLILITLAMIIAGASYYWWYLRDAGTAPETFEEEYNLVLQNYAGEDVQLSEFKRELLVVHTWASWCPYCGEEIQNLMKLKDIYGDDVTILAVNRGEPKDEAVAFTTALNVSDDVQFLLDPTDSFYKQNEGYAMPETVFINKRGVVIYHQRGPMKIQEVVEKINQLLET